MMENDTIKPPVARGPEEHDVRDQIVVAAHQYFAHYGFEKTTVSDLAREIGFSKAYIYRFFESKQAIGEAICSNCVEQLYVAIHTATVQGESATEKFRKFTKTMAFTSAEMVLENFKLHEIAARASVEKWGASQLYVDRLRQLMTGILKEGRANGEFERKTPLDETVRSIFHVLMPIMDPVYLERTVHMLPDIQVEITNLILRSLAP